MPARKCAAAEPFTGKTQEQSGRRRRKRDAVQEQYRMPVPQAHVQQAMVNVTPLGGKDRSTLQDAAGGSA